MKLYFTRHGKTEWNQQMKFQGMYGDSPLLEESLVEIDLLGQSLKDISFERIYSSPSTRARRTAEGISNQLRKPSEIIFSDQLKELGLGKLEGTNISEGRERYPHAMWALRNDPSQYDPTAFNGEMYEEMLTRSVSFIKEKVSEEIQGPLLFVSHGVTLGGCIQTLIGTPLKGVRKMGGLSNNSLSVVEYIDGKYILELWNDHHFLDEK